jgi:hypothetical protein
MKILIRAFVLVAAFAAILPAQRQPAGVTPLRPGQVRIVETYINANGATVADTTTITVLPVAVATIDLLNTFNPPSWNPNVTIGKPFCAYAVAKDAAGNVLTGRPVAFSSLDTTIAKITISQVCPDTTIDPSKMQINPLPPLQTAMRKR